MIGLLSRGCRADPRIGAALLLRDRDHRTLLQRAHPAAAVDATLTADTLAQLRTNAEAAAHTALHAAADQDEPAKLYFPDVLTCVKEHLGPMYRRSLSAQHTTWCPKWWRHAEAITRLEALWRAWEHTPKPAFPSGFATTPTTT